MSNFMKLRPEGAELFDAVKQTDITKLMAAFRNFENAPETYSPYVSFPGLRFETYST
jgi:hypothetical protein